MYLGLDDLSVRFIINLPKEELKSVERICFQVEEAQWFYEDFIRPLDPELPSLNLRNFCLCIFQHCPMLSEYSAYHHAQAFEEFLAYKTRVPVRGAIMLNEAMDQVVLVKGWKKGANWSFPRGKINKDEPDLDCAIREVYEETGYDIKSAGLIANESETKYIEMNLREQHMRLYVFRGVLMDTYFEPRTRKEISKIQWWKLADLPTLRKKKQQQEGRGEDLAINANKFYMVAPFLPQLKKWISWQRKMDKTKQAGEATDMPTIVDEGPLQLEISDVKGNVGYPVSNNGLGILLNGLRQSTQPVNTSALPEVSQSPPEVIDLSARAAQLKSFLGVQTAPGPTNVTQVPTDVSPISGVSGNEKRTGLLSLMQSKPSGQATQTPEIPMEQGTRRPPQPRSPPDPHNKQPRFSTLPTPPAFPLHLSQYHTTTSQPEQLHPPPTRPIPPPQQPAQLIPRSTHPVHQTILPKANTQQTVAPYQRTGDPEFAQYTQVRRNQPPLIPPASKLPPPKLNAQSSALLSLFKSGQTVRPQRPGSDSKVSALSTTQPINVASLMDTKQEHVPSNVNIEHAPSQQKPRQSSNSETVFVPPQISPNMRLEKAPEVARRKSEHHVKLLSLFQTPSKHEAGPATAAAATLQLPSMPVELSALPTTPSHSREPSRKDPTAHNSSPKLAQNGPIKIEKRPPQNTAKSPKPPVSATVNGPLNVPQFDILAKAAKAQKHAMQNGSQPQPQKRSPMTILARPGGSHASAAAPESKPVTERTPNGKQEKVAAPKLETFITPVKSQPPTPNLKGQDLPPKPFHPQILRRPTHVQELNEPSPIQPLPSPKHSTLADRRFTQPADHKKSLLSLFTKPSPIISPSSAVPGSAIDPTIDPLDVISPLPPTPTPQEQADAAFTRLTKTVGPLSHKDEAISGPSKQGVSRMDSINSVLAEESKFARNGGKQTPKHRTTTPSDRTFLLGYLDGVAREAR